MLLYYIQLIQVPFRSSLSCVYCCNLYQSLVIIICVKEKKNLYQYLVLDIFITKKNKKMQSFYRMVRSCHETAKQSNLLHSFGRDPPKLKKIFARLQCVISLPPMANHKGLENTTVAEVLMTREGERVGPWIWCHANVTVQDAVTQMAKNDIGSLVVLKPGDEQLIAGIITERVDYLRKIAAEDRLAKYTRVGEIMTDKDKLITVTSDTNILHAMQLMTG
ncbi:CBS domain-containing protein CBSX3 mitochondrial [Bienertia sinuspersici]